MVSAREALSSIEQAILGARRDEDRLTAMLRTATDEAARLRAKQADAYKALARLKLDALARDEVVGRLDSAERRALEALERRKTALSDLADERERLVAVAAEAEKRRSAHGEALERAVKAVEALCEETSAKVKKTTDWKARADEASAAAATAAAAADKAEQAEADRNVKGRDYEADSLFMYLWKRGYGTAQYRAGPIARYFDAKVARIVGYDAARPNYYMLNEIPLRLRQHADRLAAAAEATQAELEAVERRALEADGIAALEAAAEAAEDDVAKADAELEQARARLAATDERQAALLDESNDQSLARAVDGLAEAISREDLAQLHRQALKTPTPEDERIVASLREIEQALVRREAEAEEVRKAAVELARKRAELEGSRDRFRSSGYDNPMGEFINGALIGTIISEILRGAMNSRNLNDALADGFRRRPPPGGTFGGGFRLPRGGGRPSLPRMPRGGFRTGGRF
jgi:hypothetical protein